MIDITTDSTAVYSGLTTKSAEENLMLYGFNSESRLDEDGKSFKPSGIFLSLRFVMMIVSAAVFYMCGTGEGMIYGTVCILLTVVFTVSEIIKGTKCDEVLHKLHRHAGVRYRVIRDGEITFLPKERIVPDDIIVLEKGENVPADAHLLEAINVTCDESLFTGKKTPAEKQTGADSKNEIKQTCVYKGTRVLSGNLVARVIATGLDTKKHMLFKDSDDEDIYYTAFENTINKIAPVLTIISFVLFAAAFALSFLTGNSGSIWRLISDSLLPALSFSLCFLPAETASAVRIYYTLSALSLVKSGSMVKDLSTLEKLASVTAIIVDKTGVITKNNIEVAEEYSKNPEMLSTISILSCDIASTSHFDKAIILNAAYKHINIRELQQNELIKSFAFSDEFKLGGNLWRINGSRLLCIKGSPDNVFALCNLQPDQLYSVQKKHLQYSKQGRQVIAVAYAMLPEDQLAPEAIQDVKYNFAGFLAFTNQTRDSIPDAIRGCYRSGVKVIMVTGDSVESAEAIGKKIGLKNISVMTGDELRAVAEGFGNGGADIIGINIFAKTSPEQKLDIIRILKEQGEIVGISGDAGDEDVLLEADIGISRSLNTTGASQEACSLIMSDDNFGSIIEALKESRQTHRNIKSAVSSSLSATVVLILFSSLNLLVGKPLLLSPVILSLISVVILPVIMLFFINNTSDIKGSFFPSGFVGKGRVDKKFFSKAILQGITLFIAAIILFFLMPDVETGVSLSCFLATFVCGLLTMCWTNLSYNARVFRAAFKKGSFTGIIAGSMLLFLMIAIYVPFINILFGLKSLSIPILFTAAALGFGSQIIFSFSKGKRFNQQSQSVQPLSDS